MYLSHASLNTLRAAVMGFAVAARRGQHDASSHRIERLRMTRGPTPADFAQHSRPRLPRYARRRLLRWALVALGAGLASGAHAQARITDARSGPDPQLRKILVAAIADANSFQDRFDAEVWLTDMSHRLARQVPDPTERLEILTAVHRNATHAEVPPELVLAVIDVESNFDRFAISSTSALGLMQVMPFWVPELGYKDKNQLFDIETNVLLGCQILKYYLDVERGNLVQGLARYNGSVGRRSYADRVIERLRTKWFRR
jgi:soluble lytic murein transglycosylase-like protein